MSYYRPRHCFVDKETEKGLERLSNLPEVTDLEVAECVLPFGHQSLRVHTLDTLQLLTFLHFIGQEAAWGKAWAMFISGGGVSEQGRSWN